MRVKLSQEVAPNCRHSLKTEQYKSVSKLSPRHKLESHNILVYSSLSEWLAGNICISETESPIYPYWVLKFKPFSNISLIIALLMLLFRQHCHGRVVTWYTADASSASCTCPTNKNSGIIRFNTPTGGFFIFTEWKS